MASEGRTPLLKKARSLVLKREENLKAEQRFRLRDYFGAKNNFLRGRGGLEQQGQSRNATTISSDGPYLPASVSLTKLATSS
jgi:hypothetical protein